jgi:hypothetical protein
MADEVSGIPLVLVERFANAFNLFVLAVRDAVAEAAQDPNLAGSPALRSWQSKALPLLEKQNASVQSAAAAFAQGDQQSILALAEDKRGLAKDLDGFPLTFAGPEHARKLEFLETAVVTAAYQLCSAAGIP